MKSRIYARKKSTREQTPDFSTAPAQPMFQSRSFVVQTQTTQKSQQPDLKTSLIRAQRYGHHLDRICPVFGSAPIAVQPKLGQGKSLELDKPKAPQLLQAKLSVGAPRNMYEQEADSVAAQVVDRIHGGDEHKLKISAASAATRPDKKGPIQCMNEAEEQERTKEEKIHQQFVEIKLDRGESQALNFLADHYGFRDKQFPYDLEVASEEKDPDIEKFRGKTDYQTKRVAVNPSILEDAILDSQKAFPRLLRTLRHEFEHVKQAHKPEFLQQSTTHEREFLAYFAEIKAKNLPPISDERKLAQAEKAYNHAKEMIQEKPELKDKYKEQVQYIQKLVRGAKGHSNKPKPGSSSSSKGVRYKPY